VFVVTQLQRITLEYSTVPRPLCFRIKFVENRATEPNCWIPSQGWVSSLRSYLRIRSGNHRMHKKSRHRSTINLDNFRFLLHIIHFFHPTSMQFSARNFL